MEDVEKLLKGTVEELDQLLNAKNVLGDPIERDGATVIPIVSYGFGFGAGGNVAQKSGNSAGTGAGGGIKPGMTYGETDEFSYNIVRDPVSVYDLQATILNQLGMDHERLTYKYQGRHFRLTDIHGDVRKELLA